MDDPRDLILELTLDAPRANIWRCWTEPELLTQWFTPKPWSTASADIDPRTGGRMNVTMRSPDGEDMPNTGVFLEVIPGERIVTTDAYSEGWVPSEKPFMTTIITLKDAGEGTTAYRAAARHWAIEDKKSHETMGFKDGWTAAARQLEALAKSL
ncbi:MAG: SRPBCC family protein [Alphaproteobacteria bacterium]